MASCSNWQFSLRPVCTDGPQGVGRGCAVPDGILNNLRLCLISARGAHDLSVLQQSCNA
jgi:hypothetical protein